MITIISISYIPSNSCQKPNLVLFFFSLKHHMCCHSIYTALKKTNTKYNLTLLSTESSIKHQLGFS